jgi:hypothetical protein
MIVKSVGSNGQITLGKEFAGRLVMLDQTEPGVWTMKLGQFIPDNEKWLHTPEAKAALNEGLAWAAGNPARATNLDELEARVLAKRPAHKTAKRQVAA